MCFANSTARVNNERDLIDPKFSVSFKSVCMDPLSFTAPPGSGHGHFSPFERYTLRAVGKGISHKAFDQEWLLRSQSLSSRASPLCSEELV